ncbi:GNAT family N-acetyltransferase, partial [Stenotrophomonas maltophilia]
MQTAPLDFRLATRADEELLIALMREFYAEDRIDFDDARVRRGVDALLADPRNGEVLLWLDEAGEVVGYAVIAMGFSLEQGGHFMLLDELYL